MNANISHLPAEQPKTEAAPYRIEVTPFKQRLRARAGSVDLFDSENVLVMQETHILPTYYIPKSDINMDYLRPSDFQTFCPFKGNATHWTITVGDKIYENAAWSYETPLMEGTTGKR